MTECEHDQLVRLKEKLLIFRDYVAVRYHYYVQKKNDPFSEQEAWTILERFDEMFEDYLDRVGARKK